MKRTPLVVFGAGSLIIPFDEIETAFERVRPDIDVLNEFHGSIQVMRHVTDLHEPIDVVATADHALVPMLMYATHAPDTGKPYGGWYIQFATNRLSLAFTPQSRYADEITADNWWEILLRPDVKVGIADPRFDASGYRALMAFRLAEDLYGRNDLLQQMVRDQFTFPITEFKEDNDTEIGVPEILEPKAGAHLVVRGASIELIALLQSGDLDYAFEYESVIRQHGFEWVALPDEVNLGSPDQARRYRQVEVKLDFQRFAKVKPVFRGEQIGYGITIPSSAPHLEQAEAYIAFLLGPEGRKIMGENYQPLLDSYVCDQPANIPAALVRFCP